MNDKVKMIFSLKSMIPFESARKFDNYLVKTKISLLKHQLDHLNLTKYAMKSVEMSIKLKALVLLFHLRHTK